MKIENYSLQIKSIPEKMYQYGVSPLAKKTHDFAMQNKGSAFLGASCLLTLCLSPQIFIWKTACEVMAYSLLGFSTLQIFSTLIGKNELIAQRTGEQVNALLGIMNLCMLYLFPEISLAATFYNGSIGGASLLVRHLSAVDFPKENTVHINYLQK